MSLRPDSGSKRFLILDALRGFALLGICMANYPEFSLFTFLSERDASILPTAGIDRVIKWFLYIFIDGKFYTIFSLLFGIGFSIIMTNAISKGVNGFKIFYRRMFVLFIIGFLPLIFVWSGDILMLYALVGMTLPLFIKAKNKTILIWALSFLAVPVVVDTICDFLGVNLSAWFVGQQNYYCDKYGITDENFAYWLRDAETYEDVSKFLIMGAFERMVEFVDGNRYFKVLGLFLLGFYIGRNKYYSHIEDLRPVLKKITFIGATIGLPLSVIYAWSSISHKPWGVPLHSLFYFLSVYITGFGYIAAFTLLYLKFVNIALWKLFSLPGKMALTNYIGQSFIGMIIFYGVGLGYGADFGLFPTELVVFCVYLFEIVISGYWLRFFRFGPLEWIWRCFTYGKFLSIKDSRP